jgi:hypothetical protein
MRPTWATVGMTVACLFAGCGAASPSDQVRSKLDEFVHAAAEQDYRTICDRILDVSFLERIAASGVSCEGVMQLALAQRPSLSVGRVRVSGSSASVNVLSAGSGATRSTLVGIRLVKTSGGWRIDSLGSAFIGPAGH